MTGTDTQSVDGRMRRGPNRLAPMRFVITFGVVSMLADFVYEGARAITGPYLATFGASAALVGFVTGFGEAVAGMSAIRPIINPPQAAILGVGAVQRTLARGAAARSSSGPR